MVREPREQRHRHRPTVVHALGQRAGVPYELERIVCSSCGLLIGERPLRRAAA